MSVLFLSSSQTKVCCVSGKKTPDVIKHLVNGELYILYSSSKICRRNLPKNRNYLLDTTGVNLHEYENDLRFDW